MKLIISTKNEMDRKGIEMCKEEAGLRTDEELKEYLMSNFNNFVKQYAEQNQEYFSHCNFSISIDYDYTE